VALPSLTALLESRHQVVGAVTRPDARAGRGRALTASPVKQAAQAAGVEVLTPLHPRDPDFQARLRDLAPEACPVVAYGALLPQSALDIPRHGWVNLHFSLLPAWRGAAPVQRALMAGDTVTGASTFRIEAGLDTGPVFGTMTEAIRSTDTAGDLLGRLAAAGAGLLVATLDESRTAHWRLVLSPTTGSVMRPNSPWPRRRCAGITQPSRWTVSFGAAHRIRGRGPLSVGNEWRSGR